MVESLATEVALVEHLGALAVGVVQCQMEHTGVVDVAGVRLVMPEELLVRACKVVHHYLDNIFG